jgi:hypothetical protein
MVYVFRSQILIYDYLHRIETKWKIIRRVIEWCRKTPLKLIMIYYDYQTA